VTELADVLASETRFCGFLLTETLRERFPPGVPSTEGGSDRRTHPISGPLASLSLARCTKYLSGVPWDHVGMPTAGFANGEPEVVGSIPTTQTIQTIRVVSSTVRVAAF
jgi:hypothetical protein